MTLLEWRKGRNLSQADFYPPEPITPPEASAQAGRSTVEV